jgi:thiamine-phosphate pyrophosphorylase
VKPSNTDKPDPADNVLRVIDANLNRLREALRVVEEYARFLTGDEALAARLKEMRHSLRQVEESAGQMQLLKSRNTGDDPFASVNRPEELCRTDVASVVRANLKRGQEAARVIEEYAKITNLPEAPDIAKRLRFGLYEIEKHMLGQATDG